MKRRRRDVVTGRTRVTVTMSADAANRLRAFAAWHGLDMGDVVERSLRLELHGFGVRRGGRNGDSPDSEAAA